MSKTSEQERRQVLLGIVQRIDGCVVGEGDYVYGEVLVGCSRGVFLIYPHQRICGPKGGFRLGVRRLEMLRSLLKQGPDAVRCSKPLWDDWRDDFEPKFADSVAMTMARCKPDRVYYRLALQPIRLDEVLAGEAVGKHLFFSENETELQERWDQFIANESERPERWWKHMDTDELENTLAWQFPELLPDAE
jgi:hypothetical protein